VAVESGDGSFSVDPNLVMINEAGQVAGTAGDRFHSRAFLWEQGRVRYLDPLAGDTDARVTGLNDRGEVVGVSSTFAHSGSGFPGHAFAWANGRIREERQGDARTL
jgi:probable HAF family extracellular repeat protein